MELPEHDGEAMPTAEDRIAARLHETLDRQERADIVAVTAEKGLTAGGPEAPSVLLTVEDVARIAAMAAADIRS